VLQLSQPQVGYVPTAYLFIVNKKRRLEAV
jgi:hypothetical protein